MARTFDKVSAVLGRILRARGFEGRLSEYRILGRWNETVGAVIARHAKPQSLYGKKLTLVVDSPAWMQQLTLLKPEIIEKVNCSLGRETIKHVTLKLGEIATPPAAEEISHIRTELSSEEHVQIDELLRGISDPDTRRVVRRVIEKDFLYKKGP
jgi:predicted nucleic acid-binding Zn ribbon protein